ncbi:phosphoglycerate dehydrogenase [Bacillus sp. HMF5848]|uniref:phosphoglycerate dehydrogenase n=1 Tax=Bacillus sp. HMF5848 TaxID=2495421 RepID=UPI000F771304|nr:phosphoglycerate dehydrogenase [Bacillus sp. HMF5848]RSK27483.1 phosphoglycerate dehydrogenase [Bacillus sp. HMF5848]
MFKVLVADSISNDGLRPLLEDDAIEVVQAKVNDVASELASFDGILVRSATTVTAELMKQMTNLKIIARAGVGVDNIDVDTATKNGIIVINAPDGNTISTTEHTFAMMAALMRHIPQANVSVKSKEWQRNLFVGTELYRKTLGIIGFGRIGSELSKRARAFGMKLYVFDPFLTKARAEKLGVLSCSLEELLGNSDIITVHTPLTKDTQGILGYDTLPKTKKGVYIINCARGGIVDEQALITYLENGHIAGAALDVFESEPPTNERLLQFDQVITTPHLGASTKEAQLNVAAQVAEEVKKFVNGQLVSSSINLPSLSKDVFDQIRPYYELARKMGTILSQCMKVPVTEISMTYAGQVSDLDTTYISRSLLAGFLAQRVDVGVNDVNAAVIAKDRGISYGERVTTDTQGYANLLSVTALGENLSFTINATHIPHFGPRVVELNGFDIDFLPEGNLLYIQHTDKPGVIGKVGNILGEHNVNIATMQVGRKAAGGEAIMMLSFDKPLSDDMMHKLSTIDDIVSMSKIEI